MKNRILVVDDDAMNLKMAEFILKQKNYIVYKAGSGMECLQKLEENSIDLLLLDVEMPVMNGFKTLEKIREKDKWKKLPAAFLTADANSGSVSEAARLGAVAYIKKPFMPQMLLEKVDNILKA
jgi:CheY-like chemotaxis protein